ncbi:HAD family hydrolase [Changchengzhania lutea]|uniref:HAD family hydrolase n=1 Tax=Changchengzhania lutea TaxID=2049305 RepID=UPI00163DA859|nr:HAD family hydrolase [Changchengzhania lutea]
MRTDKVVVFDLDDTLYNEIDFLKSAYAEIAKKISNEVDVKQELIFDKMLFYYGNNKNCFKEILNEFKSLCSTSDLLFIYRNHKPNITLLPDRLLVLNHLKKLGVPMGMITDGRSIQQRNKLRALGITDFFSEIIISEEFKREKPDIKNFKYFENIFGNAQYYYIGDNVRKDFISPNKLHWTTICIKDNGFNIHSQNTGAVDDSSLPKFYVAHFDQIITLLNL